MPRRIITTQLQAAGPGGAGSVDTYFDKVIKFIPSDIVAAWVTVTGLIASGAGSGKVLWVSFLCAMIITPLWTWKRTNVAGAPPAVTQIIISTLSFAVWVFALGGPFASMGFYKPLYGSLILILFTFVVGIIDP